MSGDIVERVARAMAIADGKDPDAPAWVSFPGPRTHGICWRDQYSVKARAAIKETLRAVREPSDGVLSAFVEENGSPRDPYDAWLAAIDTLLAAIADRNPEGEDAQRLSAEHESAVPEGQSPNPDKETPHAG